MVLFVGFFFLMMFLHYQQTVRHIHTIMIDNLRESTIDVKLDVKVILQNHEKLNLKAYLDRQKAASRIVEDIYVVKDDDTLVRTSDYLYDKKSFNTIDSVNMRHLTTENIMHISMIQSNINVVLEGKKVHYKIYTKTNYNYIVESVQQRVMAQIFYPFLFFVGIVLFYILYIKRMIIKPIMFIDDFLRGLIQRMPKFYILELDNLAKSLQTNIKKLTNLAYYDTLTGLYNREAIENILLGEVRDAEKKGYQLSVALLDLDYFKKVNDSHGHDVGDQLLKEIAKIIRETTSGKEKIGRLGGDEFLIIFDHSNNNDVSSMLQSIIQRLENPINIKRHDFYIGLSIGVVTYPKDGKDISTLLKQVDMAMYQAKEEGRNRVFFYSEELGNKIKEEIALEKDIKHALKHDEFLLHYQPIINAEDEKVVAAEALIRWNHPEKGMVYPDGFIPFIEKGCCTKAVGEWVCEQAFSQQKEWLEQGIDIMLSINLSVRHILSTDFYKNMNSLVEKYNVDLKKIRLEITEYTLMEHSDATINILTQMEEQGFHFSLDDFGTGYSSITYLKDTPIGSIKIDKSFTDEISHNKGEAQLFDAILTLSKVIGLSSIAEGVEEAYQVEYLKKAGCDMIQGYYYSKPLNPEAFNAYMKKSTS